MRKVAIVVENFNCTDVLVLQWQRYNFSNTGKCKNFNFPHTSREMLYLQKYLTNFQKRFFWKMRKVPLHTIATLPIFQPENVKISNTVPAEMLYLQKYLTNFQKRFSGWKMMKVAIVVENFKCTDILVLQYNGTNFPTSRKCKNFNFSFTLSQQKCYIFKSI